MNNRSIFEEYFMNILQKEIQKRKKYPYGKPKNKKKGNCKPYTAHYGQNFKVGKVLAAVIG